MSTTALTNILHDGDRGRRTEVERQRADWRRATVVAGVLPVVCAMVTAAAVGVAVESVLLLGVAQAAALAIVAIAVVAAGLLPRLVAGISPALEACLRVLRAGAVAARAISALARTIMSIISSFICVALRDAISLPRALVDAQRGALGVIDASIHPRCVTRSLSAAG